MTYGTTEKFVAALDKLAASHTKEAKPIEVLPTLRTLRLGLNVSAADMRPLVIVRGEGEEATKKLVEKVGEAAWSDAVVGRAHYVVLEEGETFEGLTPEVGISIVQPDDHGLGGEVLAHLSATTTTKALTKALEAGIEKHERKARHYRSHVRAARRGGIEWETEIPATDKGGNRSRRR